MASPGFQITDNDRQQFISTVRDPSFFQADEKAQRKKLDSLSVFQNMSEQERGSIINGILRNRDELRRRVTSLPPVTQPATTKAPSSQQPPDALQQEGLGRRIWNAATTPLSEQLLGKGVNLTSYAQQANKQTEAEDVKQNRPQWVRTAHRFLDPMSEDAAKALDAVQTPLGLATGGVAPKAIESMEGGGAVAKAFLPYVKGAEKLVRGSFGVDMLTNFAHSAAEFAQNPTPESFSHMLAQGVLSAGVLKPEVRSSIEKAKGKFGGAGKDIPSALDAIKAAANEGGANEPPKPRVNYEAGAKRFDVSPDAYREAHEMSLEDLAKATFETRRQASNLDALRQYNEQAGSAIAANDKKLNDLRAKRNAMELNLEDTKGIDKQINDMEQRLNAVKAKVAENHTRIDEMKAQDPHKHARMYEDVLMDRSTPPKVGGPQRYGAPKPGPGRVQPEYGKDAAGETAGAGYQSRVPPQRPAMRRGNQIGPQILDAEFVDQPESAPPPPGPPQAEVVRTPEQIPGQVQRPGLPPVAPPRAPTPQETAQARATGTGEGIPRPTTPVQRPQPQRIEGVPPARALPPASQIQQPGVVTPENRRLAPPKAPYRMYAEGERPPVKRVEAPPAAPPKVQTKFAKETTGRKAETPPPSPETKAPSNEAKAPSVTPEPPSNPGEKRVVEPPKPPQQNANPEAAEPQKKQDEIKQSEPPPSTPEKIKKALQEGKLVELPATEIEADPDRFQFKQDAIGKGGTTDELRDVKKVDPNNLGVLLVWKDPANGKTYVVNGHHRLELAKRTGYDKPIPVRYIDAADAQQARVTGALANIREGRGSSMDVAKVFRDGGYDQDDLGELDISTKTKLAKDGLALSKLHDQVFNMVATGKIPEGRGVTIGNLLKSPADQEAAAKLAEYAEKSGRKMTDSEFGEALRMQIARAPKKIESETTLFGTETFERNLAFELGEVSDYVKKQIASEKRLFGLVGKQATAEKLSEAGNKLAGETNQQKAEQANQGLALYNKLSGSSGPIADILDKSASDLAEGMNAGDVKRKAYAAIRKELEKYLSTLNSGGKKEGR